MDDEGRMLMDELTRFVNGTHCSWNSVAKTLGVTQNTITNWKKMGRVSRRNTVAVIELLHTPDPGCSVEECPFRMTQDPVMLALLKLLNSMNERGRLMVYMNALELKERINTRMDGAFVLSDGDDDSGSVLRTAEPPRTKR